MAENETSSEEHAVDVGAELSGKIGGLSATLSAPEGSTLFQKHYN